MILALISLTGAFDAMAAPKYKHTTYAELCQETVPHGRAFIWLLTQPHHQRRKNPKFFGRIEAKYAVKALQAATG